MRLISTPWLRPFAALVLTLTVGPLLAAPVSEPKPKALGAAEKIRKELDQAITIEIVDQPLTMALNQLRETAKINVNFVLDRQTITQMGIDPDTAQVQVKLKDVKVRTALRSIVSTHNLSFAIVNDTILISSDEMVMYRQMQQRVTIDHDKTDFATALKQLARETGTNLILDSRLGKEANQPVTFQAEDVPLETAVRLMAEMVGLKPVRVGNVLFVANEANGTKLRNDPDLYPNKPGVPPNPGVEGVPVVPALPPAVAPPVMVPGAKVGVPVPVAPAEKEKDKTEPPAKPPDGEKPDKTDRSEKLPPPPDKDK